MYSLKKIMDYVLPPRCPISGEIVDSQGAVSPQAWAGLSFIAAPYCDACGFPFEFAMPQNAGPALCPACQGDPPPFAKARAALRYDDASRPFILGFKHGDQTQSVVSMVPWLRAAGADFWGQADLVMPVPLHRWRLLRRRYNQAVLMGAAIAKDRSLKFIPDGLIRSRATPTQGHLNAGEREKNVRKAFAINPVRKKNIQGAKIVLVDDVFTTGATVKECTKELLKEGAAEVFVLSLARVVRPTRL